VQVGQDRRNHRRDEGAEEAYDQATADALPRRMRQRQERDATRAAEDSDSQHAPAAEAANGAIAEQADEKRAGGERARMETDLTVGQAEFGLEERDDVPLDDAEIGEVAERQVAIPGDGIAAHAGAGRGNVGSGAHRSPRG
jgi:hypothetical protein